MSAMCASMSSTFPLKHYICLMFIMLMNCMSITFIFPFSGFFVIHLGLADDSTTVGLYAGLVASMLFLGRAATNFAWGLIADKYGRKAVLLTSMVASAICMCGFGFSSSMLQMCLWRLIGGMLNGIVAVAKVVGFELTSTQEDTNRGSAWLQAAWGAGLVFGPALGGFLSEPCKEDSDLRHLFGPENLFCTYPFALPGVVGALLHVAVIPCWMLLPETGASSSRLFGRSESRLELAERSERSLSSERAETLAEEARSTPLLESTEGAAESVPLIAPGSPVAASAGSAASPSASGTEVPAAVVASQAAGGAGLCHPRFLRMVAVNSIAVCSMVMGQELANLWSILPVSRGGPQWSAASIGKAWAFLGFALLGLQVQLIPRLLTVLGNRRALQCGLLGSAAVQVLMPWIVVVSSPSFSSSSPLKAGPLEPAPLTFALFTLVAALHLFTGQLIVCPLSTLVNGSADVSHRARAMGLAMAMQSLGMAVSPTAAGAILSATVERAGALAGDPLDAFPSGTHTAFLVSSSLQVTAWLLLPPEDAAPADKKEAPEAIQVTSDDDLESAVALASTPTSTALTSAAASPVPSKLRKVQTQGSVDSLVSASSSASCSSGGSTVAPGSSSDEEQPLTGKHGSPSKAGLSLLPAETQANKVLPAAVFSFAGAVAR